MSIPALSTGFFLSLSLILAIGAQNAFVLRQGLRGQHVLAVVLVCAVSDAILITCGVAGFASLAERVPALVPAMRWLGAAFLFVYGAMNFRSAIRGGEHLDPAEGVPDKPLWQTVTTILALTWLNPHVYLDTLMLIGATATRFPGQGVSFGIGAVTASFVFFFALGFGAALLRPIFARPVAWRWLDAGIGVVMWAIAAGLILH